MLFGLVQTPSELAECPQLESRDFFRDHRPSRSSGSIKVPAVAVQPVAHPVPVPDAGADSRASTTGRYTLTGWATRCPGANGAAPDGLDLMTASGSSSHPHPNPLTEGAGRNRLPLEGIRVLDSTYVFALPYAGGLLADMGAEVIKVEGPGRPDVTRTGGYSGVFAENDLGEDWWNRPSTYNLIHRGKQSITLDMTDERGRELFKELVISLRCGDGELHPAGSCEAGDLDYPNMRRLRPDVILVSNTGYGHGDGPYSGYPAQATTQEATHGHCWVTGYVDERSGQGRARPSWTSFPPGRLCLPSVQRFALPGQDRAGPVGGHGHVPGRCDVPVGVYPGRRRPTAGRAAASATATPGERPRAAIRQPATTSGSPCRWATRLAVAAPCAR